MNDQKNLESGELSCKLQAIATVVYDAVQGCEEDTVALLAMLRQLEQLHREIRDGVFQESLPVNRQQLYSLLKDIERMRLQAFLANLPQEAPAENSHEVLESDRSFS